MGDFTKKKNSKINNGINLGTKILRNPSGSCARRNFQGGETRSTMGGLIMRIAASGFRLERITKTFQKINENLQRLVKTFRFLIRFNENFEIFSNIFENLLEFLAENWHKI